MSSGHASHKGRIKQSHDTGQLDSAATTPDAPQDLLDEDEGYPFDGRAEVNPAAVERPGQPSENQQETNQGEST